MSIKTFVPKIWEARLIESYKKASVARLVSTAPTKIEGDTIIWNNVAPITVKDYNGLVEYQDLELTDVKMLMDQHKYWAFAVDDVDAVQAAGNLIDPHMREAANELAIIGDSYLFSKITDAHADNVIGSSVSKIAVNAKNAYDYAVDLNTKLNQKKVFMDNRFIVVDYAYLGLLAKDPRFTQNFRIVENGIVEGANVNGAQIVVSEELPENTITALHKGALGLGEQLRETEALRMENKFADAVRGLCVYGATVLRPKGIAVMHWELGA